MGQYHYTGCPNCGKLALVSTEVLHPNPEGLNGLCPHCGTEFSWRPGEPVIERAEDEGSELPCVMPAMNRN
jgi:predicted RNA-binding Zn-ribbon protein involved in translation (DUF1610 family)